MKTLVIGLGNPILSDDGVGWKVVEQLEKTLNVERLTFDCASLGGLSLMERMIGFQRAIIVDSMETGQNHAGSVRVIRLEDLPDPSAGHSASAHDTSLLTALQTGRRLGMDLPEDVFVVAIEIKNLYEFSEELSLPITAAIPGAVQAVLDCMERRYHDRDESLAPISFLYGNGYSP